MPTTSTPRNRVEQSGTITHDHLASWVTDGVIKDSGISSVNGGSGGSGSNFDTNAAAAAATIDGTTTDFLRTAGYYAAGDGGGALYVRRNSAPTHPLYFQSADGAYWEFEPDRPGYINVLQAGLKGDGTDARINALTAFNNRDVMLNLRTYLLKKQCPNPITYFGQTIPNPAEIDQFVRWKIEFPYGEYFYSGDSNLDGGMLPTCVARAHFIGNNSWLKPASQRESMAYGQWNTASPFYGNPATHLQSMTATLQSSKCVLINTASPNDTTITVTNPSRFIFPPGADPAAANPQSDRLMTSWPIDGEYLCIFSIMTDPFIDSQDKPTMFRNFEYLKVALPTSVAVTITVASPAVFATVDPHGMSAGNPVTFAAGIALPSGLDAGTTYYVIATGLTATNFQVATSIGGSAINTSGTQSGTHHVNIGAINTVTGVIKLDRPVEMRHNADHADGDLTAHNFGPATATISIASPAVITCNNHGLPTGCPVFFETTGALPTGIVADTLYYIISAGWSTNTFRISATAGGAAINTSGSQSGTHTLFGRGPADGARTGGKARIWKICDTDSYAAVDVGGFTVPATDVFPAIVVPDMSYPGGVFIPSWFDVEHVYEDFVFRARSSIDIDEIGVFGRHVEYINCKAYAFSAATIDYNSYTKCEWQFTEHDKRINRLIMEDCHGFGSTGGGAQARFNEVSNCKFDGSFGVDAQYAHVSRTTINRLAWPAATWNLTNAIFEDCQIRLVNSFGANFPNSAGDLVPISGFVSYSNGTITIAKTGGNDPNNYWIWGAKRNRGDRVYPVKDNGFQLRDGGCVGMVTAVTDDLSNIFVHTTLPATLPATLPDGIVAEANGVCDFIHCTGHFLASEWSSVGSARMERVKVDFVGTPLTRQHSVTLTIASPSVITRAAHRLTPGDQVVFVDNGDTLPTGLAFATTYYVIFEGLGANTFELATTQGGVGITTTGSQAGTHLANFNPINLSSAINTNYFLRGFFKRITINVLRAYTGANGTENLTIGSAGADKAFDSGFVDRNWSLVIDLLTAGRRVIDLVRFDGKQANDSFTFNAVATNVLPRAWCCGTTSVVMDSFTTDDTNDQLPLVTIDIENDQSILTDQAYADDSFNIDQRR